MSDVRAFLLGSGVTLGDGAYLERAERPVHRLEEWLRALVSRFTGGTAKLSSSFVQKVNALEQALRVRDDDGLCQAMSVIARQMQREGFSDGLLAESFALVREASLRRLGMRHHDVQLLAGHALLHGKIAEMATGEGKTLAATLSACTAAAAGVAVHIVTVNDYLAERDAQENAPLFDFFSLTVGVIKQDMPLEDRRLEYAKNIVYVSNKELTFDYLKDRVALKSNLSSQIKLRRLARAGTVPTTILRGLHLAIVDEVDSVLIDEARTPLIISETLPDDLGLDVYFQAIETAKCLVPNRHFLLGADRDIWLTEAGEHAVAEMLVDKAGLWKSALWRKELLNKALSALHLFQADQHYIIVAGKVQIVDEFTGRAMPDRTWERGLHQMIEAKEQCEITGQRRTLSQITYQRFFGRYLSLSGMTGTAKDVGPELKRVYDLDVLRIPTHKPIYRRRLSDRVFRTSEERWEAVADRVSTLSSEGRAVLVGTRSVKASETLSQLLDRRGVVHTVLNARQDKFEADAITQAGQTGQITVATNMAGRGTDIKLAPEVEMLGGLHVILTEFHESARVDKQLFGRSARQGNPGSVEAIVSLEDELFRRFATEWIAIGRMLCLGNTPTHRFLFRCLVYLAQFRAARQSRQVRLDTIKRDQKWLDALGFVGAEKK